MTDQPEKTPGVIKSSAKAATINASASAGAVVGIFAGIAIVGVVVDKLSRKRNLPATESE